MHEPGHDMDRREFVKRGLQLAAGAAALSAGTAHSAGPKEKKISLTGSLPTRRFGRTGLELPILSFGGAFIVEQWVRLANMPVLPEEDRAALVRYAYDRGIRYFDTARNYMESERIMGAGLKDVRDNVYLATKVESRKPEYVRRSVERSMKELQTDYLDCVQIHGTPGIENMTVPEAMKIHDELIKLRDEGLCRFIGLTGHGYFDKLYELISTGGFDTVLLAHGYFRKGMVDILSNTSIEQREMCIDKASELGMGIVAMKVMAGAMFGPPARILVPDFGEERLKKLPAAAIRYVLDEDRFHTLNIGMGTRSDIDENIKTVSESTKLTSDDRLLLAEFSAKAYESYAKFRADTLQSLEP